MAEKDKPFTEQLSACGRTVVSSLEAYIASLEDNVSTKRRLLETVSIMMYSPTTASVISFVRLDPTIAFRNPEELVDYMTISFFHNDINIYRRLIDIVTAAIHTHIDDFETLDDRSHNFWSSGIGNIFDKNSQPNTRWALVVFYVLAMTPFIPQVKSKG